MDPPTECATRITFLEMRDNSEEIFCFQDFTFGSASPGIRGEAHVVLGAERSL